MRGSDRTSKLPAYARRYLSHAGPIAWCGDELRDCRLDDELAQHFRVAAVLEEDTAISASQARHLGIDRSPDLAAFLAAWEREEAEHGRALRHLLAGGGCHDDPTIRAAVTETRRQRLAARPARVLGRFPPTTLVFCALGAAGEYLAIVSYNELAGRAGNPAVAQLVRAITRQEGRHMAFFLAAARARGHGMSSAGARVSRRAMARLWRPLGVASLGPAAWHSLYGSWLADDHFAARLEGMDRVVDSIAPLAGLNLMRNFLRASSPLVAPV